MSKILYVLKIRELEKENEKLKDELNNSLLENQTLLSQSNAIIEENDNLKLEKDSLLQNINTLNS